MHEGIRPGGAAIWGSASITPVGIGAEGICAVAGSGRLSRRPRTRGHQVGQVGIGRHGWGRRVLVSRRRLCSGSLGKPSMSACRGCDSTFAVVEPSGVELAAMAWREEGLRSRLTWSGSILGQMAESVSMAKTDSGADEAMKPGRARAGCRRRKVTRVPPLVVFRAPALPGRGRSLSSASLQRSESWRHARSVPGTGVPLR